MTKNVPMNDLYRIGAVSRLTGIPADTLRIWERRYQIVDPQRTEKGGRLYSQEDVTRLTIIKTLVDQGQAISTVANLRLDELNDRLSRATPRKPHELSEKVQSVVIVGQAITVRVQNAKQPDEINIIGIFNDIEEFLASDVSCDILIIEFPFLDKASIRLVSNSNLNKRCEQVIVLYAFSPSNILQQLKRMQIEAHRAPIGLDYLWHLCQQAKPEQIDWTPSEFHPETVSGETIPPRMFSSEQLAALSQISSTLKCECPHHLSSIIETMVAFEQYSTHCENETAQDAALHSYLHVMTAKSRWLMEIALIKLAEVEGIDVNTIVNSKA